MKINLNIDQINILQATLMAMKQAVSNLQQNPNIVLVDGNKGFEFKNAEVIPVVKGDSKSLSIAAASIIAKVTRDKIMEEIDSEFPQYGWLKNAGYGTKDHISAIEKYGICKYHRMSFAPIKGRFNCLAEDATYGGKTKLGGGKSSYIL